MKRFTKLLSGVVTGVMLISTMVTGFAATSTGTAADVTGTRYEEAAQVLGGLSIMVGDAGTGNFRPEDNLKRSEFAKIAVAELGLTEVAQGYNNPTKFPDVVADHWANGYINVAVNQNIIIGDDMGNFRPDDSITYAEAMTIMVRLLGHEPVAITKGQWPTGHLVVGTQIGVSKSVTGVGTSDIITRGTISQMAFNSLTIKLMEQTGYGQNIAYEVVDKTLLKDKLGLDKEVAQITANCNTRLDGASSLKSDEVQLNSGTYKVGNTNAKDLLGYYTNVYSKLQDNGEKLILVARADSNKNNTLTIESKNIESITNVAGKIVVKYWTNKDTDTATKTAYIESNVKMIYNGMAETWDAVLAKANFGLLQLLDTNNNDEFDIAFVTEYQNYVVEDTSSVSYSVVDKYGKPSLKLDPTDTNIMFSITKDGKDFKFADLKEWNVLSVTKSIDGSLINVIVSDNKVTGKVTESTSDKVKINGTYYEVANNYTDPISISDEGTFYLDMQGKIASVDSSTTLSDNYNYLLDAAKGSGMGAKVEFKLFTNKGEVKVLNGAEKIQLNNATSKDAELVLADLKVGGTVAPQLITITANTAGEITKISTAVDKTATGEFNRGVFTKNFAANDVVYNSTTSKLGKYNVNASTLVLDIPQGETDSSKYAVRNKDMFINDNEYNVVIYDMGEDLTAKVVIVTNSSGKTNVEAPIAVVDKITKVQNDRGENVDKLYAIQDGKTIELLTATEGILVKGTPATALQTGDVIQLKTNVKGEIDLISVLFNVANKNTEFTTTTPDGMTLVYGKVDKKFTDSVNVSVNGGTAENYAIGTAKVYKYDSAKNTNKTSIASAADITKFDNAEPQRLLIRIYKDEVKEFVIVK